MNWTLKIIAILLTAQAAHADVEWQGFKKVQRRGHPDPDFESVEIGFSHPFPDRPF